MQKLKVIVRQAIILAIPMLVACAVNGQIIMDNDKQIVVETDSCKLSKDILKWVFNDSSLVILNTRTNTITAVQVIKIYELRNDDEALMRDYVCKDGNDYTLIYLKKYGFYMCITDMKKWKPETDMSDEKCSYPIR